MPCTEKGHFPIHGIGYCSDGHVNRFCEECYDARVSRTVPCKDCQKTLTFTTDASVMRKKARAEFQANLGQKPTPSVPLTIPFPPTLSSAKKPTSVRDDLESDRWNAVSIKIRERAEKCVVKDYTATALKAFRMRYGLREPREKGYKTEQVAIRTVWRVSPVDKDATDAGRLKAMSTMDTLGSLGSIGNTVTPASTVGYLAMVPLPMTLKDDPLGDRHPLILAEMYANAFADRETAWRQLRVLLAVNARDDYRYVDDSTTNLAAILKEYVGVLNQAFKDHDLPARAIGVLWGPTVVKPAGLKKSGVVPKTRNVVTPINLDETTKPETSVDELRAELKKLKLAQNVANKPKGTEFPFASVRSFLVQSAEALGMIEELKKHNDYVFLHSGDGDLVTLDPVANRSLFKLYDDRLRLLSPPQLKSVARVGGATQFEVDDVRKQIAAVRCELSSEVIRVTDDDRLALTKSELLTLLAKSLDTCVRGILGADLPGTGYFAEPNTLLNAKLIEDLKLADISNENIKEMPDWSSEINRRILAKGGYTQLLLPELCFQIPTSSRTALVLVSDRSEIVGDAEHVRVAHDAEFVQILASFMNEHNTQIKHTQVNERFNEAGLNRLFSGRVKSVLPRRAEYAPFFKDLPLVLVPGVVLNAVWRKELASDVSKTWASLHEDDDLEPYFRARLTTETAASLADCIYEFPNEIDLIDEFYIYGVLRKRLTLLLERQARARGEKLDNEPEELVPVHDVLIKIDVVFRWGLGMIRRIMGLKQR